MSLSECLEKGSLQRAEPNFEFAEKELREAALDFAEAEDRFSAKQYKWATVSAYYAMFHSAKALLFAKGFKERAHYAVAAVLDELVKEGLIESKVADFFRVAMHGRESADYHYEHSQKAASEILSYARVFVPKMNEAFQKLRKGGKR